MRTWSPPSRPPRLHGPSNSPLHPPPRPLPHRLPVPKVAAMPADIRFPDTVTRTARRTTDPAPRCEVSLSWRAMGSTGHAHLVDPAPEAARRVRARSEDLEAQWSRFDPTSTVSRLNSHPPEGVAVSADTERLLGAAHTAWVRTGGRFDPSVHDAVLAAGYDRDFERIHDLMRSTERPPAPSPGMPQPRVIDGRAWLPEGMRFDPGGIGKGLAADLIAESTLQEGTGGVLVSLGGDVRVKGTPPDDRGWGVEVTSADGSPLTLFALTAGAVATSSTVRRRWRTSHGEAHHLIDPRTGLPAVTDIAQVTVLASQAWVAEVLATAIAVSGTGEAEALLGSEAAALVLTVDGRVIRLGGIQRWER